MIRGSKSKPKSKFKSSTYDAWIRDHHSVDSWPVGGHVLLKRAVNRHLACKTIQYAQLLKEHDIYPSHPLQRASLTPTFDPLNVDAARQPVLVQDLVPAPRPANHNAAAPEHIVNVQRPAALRTMKSKNV
jgi:hypothetical protein